MLRVGSAASRRAWISATTAAATPSCSSPPSSLVRHASDGRRPPPQRGGDPSSTQPRGGREEGRPPRRPWQQQQQPGFSSSPPSSSQLRPQRNQDGRPPMRPREHGAKVDRPSRPASGGADRAEPKRRSRVPQAKDWSRGKEGSSSGSGLQRRDKPFTKSSKGLPASPNLNRPKAAGARPPPPRKAPPRQVFLPPVISLSNLSRLLGVKLRTLQMVMTHDLSMKDTRADALLSFDDASLLCAELNLDAVDNAEAAFDIYPAPALSDEERARAPFRAPVITVMGHVDHGKTSLLDRLRSASVAAGEAGGITQHIGAFSVPVKAEGNAVDKITFLDTPGHAAFSNMRARGAKATDIVVLVVAADDGVMTQTKEVIELYKQLEAEAAENAASTSGAQPQASSGRKHRANIQLLVALSKIDRAEADAQRALEQLGAEGIFVEAMGGDVPCVEISSKTGQGFQELEETLAAMAELADLRAPTEGLPEGLVLESRTERGRGNTATVLVSRGKLTPGCLLVCGSTWAKVRQMVDSNGAAVREAKPGEAVLVSGWRDLPQAGDEVLSAKKEDEIKRALDNRKANEDRIKMIKEAEAVNEARRLKSEADQREAQKEYAERERARVYRLAIAEGKTVEQAEAAAAAAAIVAGGNQATLSEGGDEAGAPSTSKELRLIIKSDFSGTGEALVGALAGITTSHDAHLRVIHSSVGDVSDSDLALARTASAHILAFNVGLGSRSLQQQATQAGVPLFASSIIYEVIEYARKSLAALLPPVVEARVLGEATVAQVFQINARGAGSLAAIAGCRVTNGVMERNKLARILRVRGPNSGGEEEEGGDDGEDAGGRKVVWQGRMESLRHVKKEVNEMRKGTECGMAFEGGFTGFREGDTVQTIELVEKPRPL